MAADPLDEFFWRDGEEAEGLPELVAAPPPPPAAPAEEAREWLTFRLDDEEYGLFIDDVREVLKAPAITEVPRAPAHVLGVIMVRGEVIAVIDPRRRLGLPAAPTLRSPRVVVCDAGEGPRGLLVDAVSQVVKLEASAVEARPRGVGGVAAEAISGIGRKGEGFFVLLDLPVLLGSAPAPEAP